MTTKQFLLCMAGELGNNFFGPGKELDPSGGGSDLAYVTIGLHLVAYAAIRNLAPVVLPGPGWFYAAAAVTWDVVNAVDAYSACR
jgi:hypothetical protein